MNHTTIARTLARGIRLSVVAAVAVLLAGLLAVTQPVRAYTHVVTNSNDSGEGSLRLAIYDANYSPGPDTITFAAATNGIPIVLAGAANEDFNDSGDLDILNGGGDLTIQGNGASNTIIDGGGVDRVFHVCPGGCANTVIFNGVTIQNGKIVDGLGGGIFNYAYPTTVDGSTVISNTALYGGGIFNMGTLDITNSTIGGAGGGNTANWGGGIFNWAGTTTLDGSIVSVNTAHKGAGIFNEATLDVTNSTIGGAGAGNTANWGGGIYNRSGGTTTVDGSTVSANTSDYGGGIYNDTGGTTTVDGSTVSANTAHDGGGIYNKGTLTVRNGSTIGGAGAGNRAPGNFTAGGGIYSFDDSTTTVDASTVSANTAEAGGGICNNGTLNVQNGSTIGGAGAGNTADWGGGIWNSGTTTVDGSTVSANTAEEDGGGISNNGTLTVRNGSTIGGAGAGNQATGWGGGIYNTGGTTTVDDSTA